MHLTAPQFLDLVHHYILMITDPNEHKKINNLLIGSPTSAKPVVDEQAGFAPPSWWKGDQYASSSALTARVTLRKQR